MSKQNLHDIKLDSLSYEKNPNELIIVYSSTQNISVLLGRID